MDGQRWTVSLNRLNCELCKLSELCELNESCELTQVSWGKLSLQKINCGRVSVYWCWCFSTFTHQLVLSFYTGQLKLKQYSQSRDLSLQNLRVMGHVWKSVHCTVPGWVRSRRFIWRPGHICIITGKAGLNLRVIRAVWKNFANHKRSRLGKMHFSWTGVGAAAGRSAHTATAAVLLLLPPAAGHKESAAHFNAFRADGKILRIPKEWRKQCMAKRSYTKDLGKLD